MNLNNRTYPKEIYDDYVSFYEMQDDLDDICLELSDIGYEVFKRNYCLEFQHSKCSAWNIAELMDEDVIDEVIDRLKDYVDTKNYYIKVRKIYHHSYSRYYFFRRLINKYKGRLSFAQIEFVNKKTMPLMCWDLVPNNSPIFKLFKEV